MSSGFCSRCHTPRPTKSCLVEVIGMPTGTPNVVERCDDCIEATLREDIIEVDDGTNPHEPRTEDLV